MILSGCQFQTAGRAAFVHETFCFFQLLARQAKLAFHFPLRSLLDSDSSAVCLLRRSLSSSCWLAACSGVSSRWPVTKDSSLKQQAQHIENLVGFDG